MVENEIHTNNLKHYLFKNASSSLSNFIVPNTKAPLLHWTATDSLWVRYAKELASPDTLLNRWPNSLRNSVVLGPNTPVVSITTGVKKWHESRCLYFYILSSAC